MKQDIEERVEKAVGRWIDEAAENDEALFQEVKEVLDKKKKQLIMDGIGIKIDNWGKIESISCPAFSKVLQDEKIQAKIEKWYRTNVQSIIRRTVTRVVEREIDNWAIKHARTQLYNLIDKEIKNQLNPAGVAQMVTQRINDVYLKLHPPGETND